MDDAVAVLEQLKAEYGELKYYLNFSNRLELLVAAILSPQVRDEVVNAATPGLFAKFRTAKDYAGATPEDLLKFVSKISFAGKKAEHIIAAAKILVNKHGGEVPDSLNALVELPGVGKKTAVVILAHGFNRIEGISVDTHVIRVSFRLGWTVNKNPDKISVDLEKLLPKTWWKQTPLLIKAHGRAVCRAPIPLCKGCLLKERCPKKGV